MEGKEEKNFFKSMSFLKRRKYLRYCVCISHVCYLGNESLIEKLLPLELHTMVSCFCGFPQVGLV
uniref:Ovule protein n=1 Tax=Romanomermis culicivorax TaxID=13658 RepID=A0A915JD56_ROMCU